MSMILALPTEILEMIFRNLDGKSFVRLSGVCTQWRCITGNMDKSFWKPACLNEIDLCVVEELIGYRNTPPVSESDSIWKLAYTKWYRGRMIYENPDYKKSFPASVDNPITCIKVSGSWILTGHRSGSVYAWNQFSGSMCYVLMQHLIMVNDFALVDILHSGPYGSMTNSWDHHHIISVSKDPTVQVNSLLSESLGVEDELQIVHYHSCGFSSIRIFGKLVAMSSTDNSILVFQMEYQAHRLALHILHQIIGPADILNSFGFWQEEFQCFCVNGHLKLFCTVDNRWQTVAPQLLQSPLGQPAKMVQRSIICSSFLFRGKTVFLKTDTAMLLVSIDGVNYSQLPLMPTIKTSIVSIAQYGSVLAIGTEAGHLFLYHVAKLNNLLDLDLKHPAWAGYLSEASIVALDVFDNGTSPVIAACTTERIFIIKWRNFFCEGVSTSSYEGCTSDSYSISHAEN